MRTGGGSSSRGRRRRPPARPLAKTLRLRDKYYRQFVAAQPCLVRGRSPADPIICASPSRARWRARPATNSPFRCAGCITTRCISAATRRRGGRASISTRFPSRWRFGAARARARRQIRRPRPPPERKMMNCPEAARHGRRKWAILFRRGAMMPQPATRAKRQTCDGLRSCATPIGGWPPSVV